MDKTNEISLINVSGGYYFYNEPKIYLDGGSREVAIDRQDQFMAIAFEKSKAAKHWEDSDYFKITVLVKAADQKYYLTEIEHSAYILSPIYIDDDSQSFWIKDNTEFTDKDKELLSNLYCLSDSRSSYTLSVNYQFFSTDRLSYFFYEKYICYTISVGYEADKNYDQSITISPYSTVRCKLSSQHPASDLEDIPTKTLEYKIGISHLLRSSIFQCPSFKIWHGKVIVDGLKVKLIP